MITVFLSYPSEVSQQGERLSTRLTAAGYDVFFAPRDLEAAGAFDTVLSGRIKSADLFIFVITRDSIARGRYTRTELALAERRFGSRIAKRLLPVTFEEGIPERDLPPSLSSIHILRPEGDAIAETIIALEALARPIQRRRSLRRMAALLTFLGAMTGTGYWTHLYLQPPGLVYESPRALFAPVLRDAGLPDSSTQIDKLALPNSFLGKRISLLAFSSFEGTDRDRDFWCVVTACNVTEFAPDLRDHPNESPVEHYGRFHSGTKSWDFAPKLIGVGDPARTVSATRHKRVFNVTGAERVWLYFWSWSDSNSRPRDVHNCDSSLNLLYRLDGEEWSHLTSVCGAYPGDSSSGDAFFPHTFNVLLNGVKTFELALVFQVQHIEVSLRDRSFLIDDFTIFAEWPSG